MKRLLAALLLIASPAFAQAPIGGSSVRVYEGNGGGNYVAIGPVTSLAANRTCTPEDDATPLDPCVSGGASITVDLGDDGGNDTTSLDEIATTGTCGTAFAVAGNKLTMDCDEFPGGSGATIRWRPAAGCDNATAIPLWDPFTSFQPSPQCGTGSNSHDPSLLFADADGDYRVEIAEMLPASFTGDFDLKGKWKTSATSGDVVWQISTACVADAETGDPAWNTASTATDTAKGTTLQHNDFTISNVTVTGCAAGELMKIRLLRNRTHASDSLAAQPLFIGAELSFQ